MRTLQENRNMLNWRTRLAAFVLVLAAPLAAVAQNSIRSITTTQQAGAEVVRIELAEPLAAVPNGFVTRGDSIAPGTLGVQWVRAMIGYEFRIGRTAFLPLAGVAAVGSAREAEEGEEIEGGATWSAGAQIGYRILPADVGPHIDLRLRVGTTGAGLVLDDPALAGVRWSVQIGVAVVARPIVVIP